MKRTGKASHAPEDAAEGIVLLDDLAPIRDVRGGAGRLRFGESLAVTTVGTNTPNEETAVPSSREAKPPRRPR